MSRRSPTSRNARPHVRALPHPTSWPNLRDCDAPSSLIMQGLRRSSGRCSTNFTLIFAQRICRARASRLRPSAGSSVPAVARYVCTPCSKYCMQLRIRRTGRMTCSTQTLRPSATSPPRARSTLSSANTCSGDSQNKSIGLPRAPEPAACVSASIVTLRLAAMPSAPTSGLSHAPSCTMSASAHRQTILI